MLQKAKGIVLKTTNYGENSVIAKIYTDKFGLQSFIINAVKKGNAKIKMNMLQPLSILELVAYIKPNQTIHRLKEAQNLPIFKTIPYQISKTSIAIFITEVIYKSLNESDSDEDIFEFIYESICLLDNIENQYAHFPLLFLIKFSAQLGFGPELSITQHPEIFDLINGVFTKENLDIQFAIEKEYFDILNKLLSTPMEQVQQLNISKQDRNYLLKKLLLFYNLHVNNFGTMNSFEVLREVFD